jgi:hypothetical protein
MTEHLLRLYPIGSIWRRFLLRDSSADASWASRGSSEISARPNDQRTSAATRTPTTDQNRRE